MYVAKFSKTYAVDYQWVSLILFLPCVTGTAKGIKVPHVKTNELREMTASGVVLQCSKKKLKEIL